MAGIKDTITQLKSCYEAGDFLTTRRLVKELLCNHQADIKANDLAEIKRIGKATSFDPMAVIIIAASVGVLLFLIFRYAV